MTDFNDKQCSICDNPWESPNTLPEDLLAANPDYYENLGAAKEAAKDYGWTEENDKRFIKGYTGVQYTYNHPQHYDGISEHRCNQCGTCYGRWTGKILAIGEFEERFGGK